MTSPARKKRRELEKKWRKYLKDSRLTTEEMRKRAVVYARRGAKPPED